MPKKDGRKDRGFTAAVSARFPGLVEKIQGAVEDSERRFAGNAPESDGSFLWEHSVHVGALAFNLARAEKADPELAAVAALLHDAGKFAGGRYHDGERPEEAEAARLAAGLLRRSGMKAAERLAVVAALESLYRESAPPNALAAIVHDADFLSKSGYLGVAQFFIKSALRGRTLRTAVARTLSKELTYAACLSLNMRTAAGRVLAGQKASDTTSFYEAFLRELREIHNMSFKINRLRFVHPSRGGAAFEVRLVLPEACDSCGGSWRTHLTSAPGTKCERIEAKIGCLRCGASSEISFCLPEVVPAK